MNEQLIKIEGLVDVIKEEDVPEVISKCYLEIVDIDKKIAEAENDCQIALDAATKQIFAKTMKQKEAINSTQDAVKCITKSQTSITQTQRMLFDNQQKMAYAMKYLLMLGASSIAMNKKVIDELEAKMKEAETGELSKKAADELKEVVELLKDQQNALIKQEKIAKQLSEIKETLNEYGEEIDNLHSANKEQNKKHIEHDKQISDIGIKNKTQDDEISKLRNLLYMTIGIGVVAVVLAIVAIII